MGDLLGSPRVAPLPFCSDFFLLALSFASVPQARFAHTPFVFLQIFLLSGLSLTPVQHARFEGQLCSRPKIRAAELVFGAKASGDLEIRESAPGLLLSGVEVHRCITDHL